MILVVGLGNPGKKFQKSRHNLGFMVVEEFRIKNDFKEFKFSRKLNSLISGGFINNQKIILAKPQIFMNLSGKAVKSLINNYQLTINNLFVIHDDIDLPLGKIRISKGQGAAGHKGVQSIIKELGAKDFIRVRIGIRPQNSTFSAIAENVERFVLQDFDKKEGEIIQEIVKKICQAIIMVFKEGLEKTMQKYNQ